MSPQYREALIRAVIGATLTAAIAAVTALQLDQSTRDAILTGLLTWLTYVVTRLGIEGTYDTSRANSGEVKTSDVGAVPIAK